MTTVDGKDGDGQPNVWRLGRVCLVTVAVACHEGVSGGAHGMWRRGQECAGDTLRNRRVRGKLRPDDRRLLSTSGKPMVFRHLTNVAGNPFYEYY